MTDQHPITPPYELIEEWIEQFKGDHPIYIATLAAQYGADQELEACCEWLEDVDCDDPQETAKRLRAARRTKPPSLKEQALAAQQRMWDGSSTHEDWQLIRRALEALPE